MIIIFQRNKTIAIAAIFLSCLLLMLGILALAVSMFNLPWANAEEVAARDGISQKFGLKSDWAVIDRFVTYQYLHLGLTRAEVHSRLSAVGTFTVKREEHFINDQGRNIDYEEIVFDNEYVLKGLGLRSFEYDSQTGLLVGTLKNLLPSGEQVRLLPPP